MVGFNLETGWYSKAIEEAMLLWIEKEKIN